MGAISDNPGVCPKEAIGKKVMVRLFNGQVHGPWPATGQGKCSWSISSPPHPYEIKQWRLADG